MNLSFKYSCASGPGFNPWSSHTKDSKKWYLMLPSLTLSTIR